MLARISSGGSAGGCKSNGSTLATANAILWSMLFSRFIWVVVVCLVASTEDGGGGGGGGKPTFTVRIVIFSGACCFPVTNKVPNNVKTHRNDREADLKIRIRSANRCGFPDVISAPKASRPITLVFRRRSDMHGTGARKFGLVNHLNK
jgi:hypothetical protein